MREPLPGRDDSHVAPSRNIGTFTSLMRAMSDASNPLKGCRVLILEDEYLLAADLEMALRDAGGVVLGPLAIYLKPWNN